MRPDLPAPPARPVLYRNGSVYSPADPFASAVLVDGARIAWVGSEEAASSIQDPGMDVVDLDGALLAPAFVDSHVHVTETALALSTLDLSGAGGLQELLDAVAAAAGTGTGVLLGSGWDESGWPERRAPRAEELERAAGGREVYLTRVDVHSGVVSTGLAHRLGLPGTAGWHEDGRVEDAAHDRVRTAVLDLDDGRRTELHRLALRHAASRGYAALAENSAPQVAPLQDLVRLVALANHGVGAEEPLPRVLPYLGELVADAEGARAVTGRFDEALAQLLGRPVRRGESLIGLAGDLCVDGALGSRTAALREPYADAPGSTGRTYLDAGQIGAHLAATTEAGLQGGFHVIGDAAMDAVLEGLDRAAERVGERALRAAGHRLEHAEMVDAEGVEQLARASVTVSVQPGFDAAWGGPGGLYEQRLGPGRAAGMNPLAAFHRAGVPVTLGSDAPVVGLSPWETVRACLAHHDPGQRISARAAFLASTRGAWRAARTPDPMQGQLAPGTPATFAVWDVEALVVQQAEGTGAAWSTDPRARTPLLPALDTDRLPECRRTVLDGVELYRADA
ncbi:amidohydrolase [Kocuria flava]|uniref:Amidohydrolase n=1 Tax=Kocuria flava TaxID=446860 RepID=A0A0U3GJ10_9MICC|nr:amidohydrolase family protein [Kocuria flava]ALU40158.1 amidohydrolase [Kocuria flava]GEO93752.1 amidohydrolase [Kocuria flava]